MAKRSLPLSKVYQLLEPGPVVMLSTYLERPNVMTMSWHMMIDFVPPLIACVVSDQNYTFDILKKTKECVINIPTVDLAKKTVLVGNISGRQVDKFEKFHLSQEKAMLVRAPLLTEAYANLECQVIDGKMSSKYNMFILQVLKAWVRPSKKRPRMIHHCGKGSFVVDGNRIKLPSKMD